ncbi:MAG: hypothetical protein ABIU05_01730, partial [Nitrospirales bacterium]
MTRRYGQGLIYQRTYKDPATGAITILPTWWIQTRFRGERFRESSGSIVRMDAVKLLRRRMAEMGRGQLRGPDVDKTTFAELVQLIDLPGLIWSRMKVRVRLDRNQGGHGHAQETVHTRRGHPTSADG